MHNIEPTNYQGAKNVIDPARTKVGTKDTPTTKRRTTTIESAGIGLAYEWFLEVYNALVYRASTPQGV